MDDITDSLKDLEYSVIGKNTSLNGDLTIDGPTYLYGSLTGSITSSDNAPLCFGNESVVSGKVKCADLDIQGKFSGEIDSSGTVKIYPGAQVKAKLNANNLIIKAGAMVNLEGNTTAN